jgi:hypothetical protein
LKKKKNFIVLQIDNLKEGIFAFEKEGLKTSIEELNPEKNILKAAAEFHEQTIKFQTAALFTTPDFIKSVNIDLISDKDVTRILGGNFQDRFSYMLNRSKEATYARYGIIANNKTFNLDIGESRFRRQLSYLRNPIQVDPLTIQSPSKGTVNAAKETQLAVANSAAPAPKSPVVPTAVSATQASQATEGTAEKVFAREIAEKMPGVQPEVSVSAVADNGVDEIGKRAPNFVRQFTNGVADLCGLHSGGSGIRRAGCAFATVAAGYAASQLAFGNKQATLSNFQAPSSAKLGLVEGTMNLKNEDQDYRDPASEALSWQDKRLSQFVESIKSNQEKVIGLKSKEDFERLTALLEKLGTNPPTLRSNCRQVIEMQ